MLQLKKIGLFLTIILLLTSCSADFFDKGIDIDVDDHTSKLAGTALLGSAENTNQVLVSFSQGPFGKSNEIQVLKDATVTVAGNNEVIDFYPNDENVFYFANTNINFVPNNEYTLTIAAPNYETISATQVYPEKVPVLEASLTDNIFKIKINDIPNQKDYYLLQLVEVIDNDEGFNEQYIFPFGPLTKESGFCYSCVTFNDASFDGEQGFEIVVTNDNYNQNEENTTYKAILYHITEDFYRYDTTLRISNYAEDNPFVEPVILHRNFDNGYGVFALVNKTEFIFNN